MLFWLEILPQSFKKMCEKRCSEIGKNSGKRNIKSVELASSWHRRTTSNQLKGWSAYREVDDAGRGQNDEMMMVKMVVMRIGEDKWSRWRMVEMLVIKGVGQLAEMDAEMKVNGKWSDHQSREWQLVDDGSFLDMCILKGLTKTKYHKMELSRKSGIG